MNQWIPIDKSDIPERKNLSPDLVAVRLQTLTESQA